MNLEIDRMSFPSLDDFLSQNLDTEITILFVGDYNVKVDPYYCKVILKCKRLNGYIWFPTVEIVPESLHKKYKIGAKFFNKKQIGYDSDVNIASFEIDNTDLIENIIGDNIDESDIIIISYESTYQYFLKQNCYFITCKEYDLIIPHYAIANHFHFRSSSLKHAIMDSTFDSLCTDFKINSEEKVTIYPKANTNISDLKTICNFLYNNHLTYNYIFDTFKYYNQQFIENRTTNYQIKSKFPIEGIFNIKTFCMNLSMTNRPKFLVLGIYQDDYIYPFKEIDYFIGDSKLAKKENIDKPSFYKEAPFKSGKTVNKTPSAQFITANNIFIENDFEDVNEIILNPIVVGIKGKKLLGLIHVEKTVDGSFEPITQDGDENVQKERASTIDNKDLDFNFEDFEKLYEKLIENEEIFSPSISAPILMIPQKNKKNRISTKYYIFDNIPRSYLYGGFVFRDKRVGFVEIERGGSWEKLSTWFFILESKESEFAKGFIDSVILEYIGNKKTFEKLDEEYGKKEIIFFRKVHPESISDENAVEYWADTVIDKIISFIIE